MRRPGRAVVVGGLAILALVGIAILAPDSSASTGASVTSPFSFAGEEFVIPTPVGTRASAPVMSSAIEGGAASRFCAGQPPATSHTEVAPTAPRLPTDANVLVICPFTWGPGAQQVAVVRDAAAVAQTAQAINAFTQDGCELTVTGLQPPVVRAVFVGGAGGPVSVILHRELIETSSGYATAVTSRYDELGCGPVEVIDGLVRAASDLPLSTFDLPRDGWFPTGLIQVGEGVGADASSPVWDAADPCGLWLALHPPNEVTSLAEPCPAIDAPSDLAVDAAVVTPASA